MRVDFPDEGMPRDWMPLFEWSQWFHAKQHQFIDRVEDKWEIAYIGGNGSGKTRILYWTLAALCLGIHPCQFADPPLRVKVLVTDFEHGLEKIAWETMFLDEHMTDGTEIGPMVPMSEVASLWKKEDRSLRFKNGSVMSFMTSEQKRRLHSGTTFDVLACDEEALYPAYDESKRGLRKAKGGGRIFHALTPPYEEGKGPSWTKDLLLDPWEEGTAPEVWVIQAAMADNPSITPEYIEKFSRGKTKEQLDVQLHGRYPTWGRIIHEPFVDEMWDPATTRGNLLPYDWEVPFFDDRAFFEFALDWHPAKPAAAIWSVEDPDGNVIVYDELTPEQSREKTIDDLSDIIFEQEGFRFGAPPGKKVKGDYLRIRRFGEPKMKDKSHAQIRGFNAWDAFRQTGLTFTEGWNRQPEVGISIVNDFLRGDRKTHPRLFIRENCYNTRRYMKNHYWQLDTAGVGKPDPKWSDYPICIRWILLGKSRKRKKKFRRRMPVVSYRSQQQAPYTRLPHGATSELQRGRS